MMNDPAIRFREVLQAVRTEKGLTQTGLSMDAGYDQSYVCRLENGQRLPTRDTVSRLADVLEPLDKSDRAELFASAGFWPDEWAFPATLDARREVGLP